MRGARAKMLRRAARLNTATYGPWQKAGSFQTGWYGKTFIHGGARRAYQNAKAFWRAWGYLP
jgi:hypothetical protein